MPVPGLSEAKFGWTASAAMPRPGFASFNLGYSRAWKVNRPLPETR
jgi:hypothetical protein